MKNLSEKVVFRLRFEASASQMRVSSAAGKPACRMCLCLGAFVRIRLACGNRWAVVRILRLEDEEKLWSKLT
jgi:hypothetical protein